MRPRGEKNLKLTKAQKGMSLRNEKIFTNIFSSPTEGGGVNFLWKGWVESSLSFIALIG